MKFLLCSLVLLIVHPPLLADAGGYDPCQDIYKPNYILWAGYYMVWLICWFSISLIIKKIIPNHFLYGPAAYGVSFFLSFLFLAIIANVYSIESKFEYRFNQKHECLIPSNNATNPDSPIQDLSTISATNTTKLYDREEFKRLIIGQPPSRVMELVGKPDSTSQTSNTSYWYYHTKTIDSITGNVDNNAQVVFGDDNLVQHVNF